MKRDPAHQREAPRSRGCASPVLSIDSHRMLFVHVQRTGDNAVSHVLASHIDDQGYVRRRNSMHEPLRLILRREPELFRYWTFGFVRNPGCGWCLGGR
jgi:hypothetical protein